MRFLRLFFLSGMVFWMAGCAVETAPSPAVSMRPGENAQLEENATAPVILIQTSTPTAASGSSDSLPAEPAADTEPALPDPTATQTGSLDNTASATPTFDPESWSKLPVIPTLSPRAMEILKEGLAKGNNPHAFAKIGDCESQASWFLSDFDLGPKYYSMGQYENDLGPVIPYYAGSFKRVSLAARPGFSSASVMAPIWADKQTCQKDESPLACEYRIQRPVAAFIMLGSNDATNPKTFEGHMRDIIEFSISQGVLPVLGTKADNVEKDYFINKTIARLAYEYGLPLWNFWSAVQGLPDHGLQADGVHLTFGTPRFDDPGNMEKAWPVRNLNALQILKLVMDVTK